MSFILEALKKSENERQRQAGPGFATIPESPERKSRGRWPLVVAGLLILNLAVLAYVLLRDKPQPATLTGDTGSSLGASVVERPATVPQETDPAAPTPSTPTAQPAVVEPDPAKRTGPLPVPTSDANEPPAAPVGRQVRPLSGEAVSPNATQEAAPATASSSAAQRTPPGESADEQRVESARPVADKPATTTPSRAESGLPTANDLRLQGFLTGPPLHLDLHVYYPDKQRRVVFISGSKYREGDRVNSGAVVREIVPEGVIMEDRGRRFLLEPK
jgi:general secretion pathway protein B